MALDFPNSPAVGQQFTAAGAAWTWDGAKWLPSGLAPTVVPGINDNRIINGDMRIDQRWNGASASTGNVYTVDRWQFGGLSSKINWGRNYGSLTPPSSFPYYLGFLTGLAYTPAAGETFYIYQNIEADMVSDFAWGTASAQPVTLSFWVQSNQTGTFSGSLSATPANRSYPFTYSVPVANTWTRIVITVPGDTTGAWVMSGNAGGVRLFFDLGTGSSVRGTPNTWQAASLVGATGAVSIVTILNATFNVTGVKLEVGSVATPFNRQSLAKSMADCQRYYQMISVSARATATAADFFANSVAWVTMRATPTTVLITAGTRANISAASVLAYALNSGGFTITATGAGGAYALNDLWSVAAEL